MRIRIYTMIVLLLFQNATILMNLGALYHLIGNFQKAEKVYQQALVYEPNNDILLTNIKRLQKQKARVDREN